MEMGNLNLINQYNELEGSMHIDGIKVTARADRINQICANAIEIIDFKTGYTPSHTEILEGKYPQLPLEALIAELGGFNLNANDIKIKYIAIKGRDTSLENKRI